MANRIYKRMDYLLNTRDNILTLQPGKNDKFIVFSDFHRGLSDHADDFKDANEIAYRAALSHYFHHQFTMIHLGDIEELKEQLGIRTVINHHELLLRNEILFHQNDRLIKVFGNHDSQWSNPKNVRKHLHQNFPGIEVYEGIVLEYDEWPNVFLVHGHQGYSWFKTNIAEKFVLPFYRIGLNLFGIERKTNYESYCKIEKIENQFYEWAKDQDDILVIFGHTHRPLWGSSTHIDNLEKELDIKRKELEDFASQKGESVREVIKKASVYGIENLVNKIKSIISKIKDKMEESGVCRAPIPLPLLFNTGNGIFKDGDITGIEIENGSIRLIKWGRNGDQNPVRQILEEGELSSLIIA